MSDSLVAERTSPSSAFDWDQPGQTTPVAQILLALVRKRGTIVLVTLVAAIAALVVALLTPPAYTATAQFFPEGQRPLTGTASAIASQLGMSLPSVDALNNALIYPEIIQTPSFMRSVAEAKYRRPGGVDSVDLYQVYGGSAGSVAFRHQLTVDELNKRISVSPAIRTGIVTVSVQADDPELAYAIAKRVLDEIDQFNLNRRQSRARAERQFVERRLAEMKEELRQTEDRIQAFLQQNRDFSRAPELALAYQRLERQATLQRSLYTTLAQSFEQAKIEEVRDTPVVTVISPPEVPLRPNARGRLKLLAGFILAGLLLGGLLAYYQQRSRAPASGDAAELRQALRSIGADLRRGRFVRALFGGRTSAA